MTCAALCKLKLALGQALIDDFTANHRNRNSNRNHPRHRPLPPPPALSPVDGKAHAGPVPASTCWRLP